jgi:hypothetical protein
VFCQRLEVGPRVSHALQRIVCVRDDDLLAKRARMLELGVTVRRRQFTAGQTQKRHAALVQLLDRFADQAERHQRRTTYLPSASKGLTSFQQAGGVTRCALTCSIV